jgi:hypothetical protein
MFDTKRVKLPNRWAQLPVWARLVIAAGIFALCALIIPDQYGEGLCLLALLIGAVVSGVLTVIKKLEL